MTDRVSNPLDLAGPESGRLQLLAARLRRHLGSLRYVDYRQAERDCELLAARILERYPRSELERCSFEAIPRGGLIVLGMLSYLLDLRPEQLPAGPRAQAPAPGALIIVDDCALTGARFAAALAATAGRAVAFVHLYSPPELRRAILRREERVECCLAAHDLHDQAPEAFDEPQAYRAWRERWLRRLGADRYWLGQPEMVCFAWSEPDGLFWNPVSEEVEKGWRMMPPHLCLKNKARLVAPEAAPPALRWRVPRSVISGHFDGRLWLCQTDSDRVYALDGVAAEMWRLLAGRGSVGHAARALARDYAAEEAAIRRDLEDFAGRLLERGLLERVDGSVR